MSELPKQFDTKFIKKEQVAQDAYSFYFEKPDIEFLPGQYMQLKLDIPNPDIRGATRLFSITSSPTENHLRITTRIIQSSFKLALSNLKPNDQVHIVGPYGKFIFDETDNSPHIFLAGGIGITPYLSMIKYAYDKNLNISMTLFTSFRKVEDIVYRDVLTKIAAEKSG